jgi:hypothetical protein
MTDRFDPNIPPDPNNPTAGTLEGDVNTVVITDRPTLGTTNLVVRNDAPFDIAVGWHVFGNLAPVWLGSQYDPNWVVTAYAESEGPGQEKLLGKAEVAVSDTPFSLDMPYKATITVPAGTLAVETPEDPQVPGSGSSGTYKIIVRVFLRSTLTIAGYDMMGYAEGPIIMVEN